MIISMQITGNKWSTGILQATGILFLSVVVSLVVNDLRPDKLPLKADRSVRSRLTLDSGKSLIISLDDAKKHFFNHSAIFLDARSSESYEQGHIEGAYNLPSENMEEKFPEVMENISSESLIVVYCDGENCHSGTDVAHFLSEVGFNRVGVLVNGWSVWQKNHLPVDRSHRNIS